ncbi:MAG: flippase-like domain-containing protein, partial [Turicibacter sp.]|nr:flippase-like domain-containing protein [Turicibacter sp.]
KKRIYYFINGLTRLLAKIKLVKDVSQFQQKLEGLVKDYMNGALYIRQHPKLIIRMVIVITIQLTAIYLVPYFVYKAFNLNTYSLLEILTCQAILSLATSAIPLPGAVGVSENLFISTFRLFFDGALLIPAMLLTRGINFYTFLIISGIVSLIVHVSSYKKQQKSLS